jgi:hypothetical protein
MKKIERLARTLHSLVSQPKEQGDSLQFTIKVTMKKRWVPHFLGMLDYMQRLGGVGASRKLSFYSDGDGDFRPKFEFHDSLPVLEQDNMKFEERHYDAG